MMNIAVVPGSFLHICISVEYHRSRTVKVMAVGGSFPALMAFTLVGAYFLQRTLFADKTFRTVVLSSLAVSVLLKGFYSLVIWRLFINPLRHLPKVPVSTYLLLRASIIRGNT